MAEVFPVASGYPEYSGVLIPEIWSPKLLIKFYKATVLGEIANTDYEGDISNMGDTVHIRTTPDMVIQDYNMGQRLDFQTPEPTLVDLKIDKGKYFAFRDDAVQYVQADYNYVDDWTSDAGMQMGISIDTQVLADSYADAHADNIGATAGAESSAYNMGATGSPVVVDKTNIVDYIADMGAVLDEQHVPNENRWLVAPAWFCNRIKKSDLKDASLSGDGESIARNGRVGMIDRFTIYMSTSLAQTTDGSNNVWNMMFGHKSAITFASQLILNDGPMKHPDFFGDFYRGLQVYGFETVKTEALGHFYARPG